MRDGNVLNLRKVLTLEEICIICFLRLGAGLSVMLERLQIGRSSKCWGESGSFNGVETGKKAVLIKNQ